MRAFSLAFVSLVAFSTANGQDFSQIARNFVEIPESRARFAQGEGACHDIEGDKPTCEWCQKSSVEKYPLNVEDIQRSFFEGNACLWKELARKFDAGEIIHIGIIGGSMTRGVGCYFPPGKCAWPVKLEELFNSSNVLVHSYAIGGANYDHFLSNGDLQHIECDLLLVDLAVNAQSYQRNEGWLRHSVDEMIYDLLKAHPQRPLLWVTTYRASSDTNGNQPAEIGEMSYDFTGESKSYRWLWYSVLIKDHEQPVISHYDIPVASYRDAAWRGTHENGVMKTFDTPREDQPCLFNANYHPSSLTHILVADVIYYAIHGMLAKARKLAASQDSKNCNVVRSPMNPYIAIPHHCSEIGFITHLTSSQQDTFKPTAVTTDWKFGEDRKGKPGWIIDLNGSPYVANSISFQAEIGKARSLETTYLKSHSKIGAVDVVLTNSNGEVAGQFWIQAFEKEGHVSIPVTMQYKLDPKFSPGLYTVTYSLSEHCEYHKFKLIAISSC